jgi:hypothetical protein
LVGKVESASATSVAGYFPKTATETVVGCEPRFSPLVTRNPAETIVPESKNIAVSSPSLAPVVSVPVCTIERQLSVSLVMEYDASWIAVSHLDFTAFCQ